MTRDLDALTATTDPEDAAIARAKMRLSSVGAIADGTVARENVAASFPTYKRNVMPGGVVVIRIASCSTMQEASGVVYATAVAEGLLRAVTVAARLLAPSESRDPSCRALLCSFDAAEHGMTAAPASLAHAPKGAIDVSLLVPADAPLGSVVRVDAVALAGEPVAFAGATLPAVFSVSACVGVRGMPVLEKISSGNLVTPAVSEDGRVFVPRKSPGGVSVHGASGEVLGSLSLDDLALPASENCARSCAFDDRAGVLFVATHSIVAAYDGRTFARLWHKENLHIVGGIASLSHHALVAVTELDRNTLHILHVSDGSIAASIEGRNWASYVTYDAIHDTLFTSTYEGGKGVVRMWRWDTTGNELRHLGLVDGVTATGNHRPLAVVPGPAHEGRISAHLVIGTQDSDAVEVIELPDMRRLGPPLPHVLNHRGAVIKGIAADPAGGAIVLVNFGTSEVVTVPWPPQWI